jgi:hypothetical protein
LQFSNLYYLRAQTSKLLIRTATMVLTTVEVNVLLSQYVVLIESLFEWKPTFSGDDDIS